MVLPNRKLPRHPKYDYNMPGYYFITVCTKGKACILGHIVGRSLPDAPVQEQAAVNGTSGGCSLQDIPLMQYSNCGRIVSNQLDHMSSFYNDIILEKYVVMPNHIHLLLHIPGYFPPDNNSLRKNAAVSQFVGTFKRFCSRQIGHNIWQTSFHDHVIRGEADYQKIWMYIETNPMRWQKDCFYTKL